MTAANAANTQVRRPVPPQRPAAPAMRAAAVPASAAVARFDQDDDDFVLNLSDIPRMPTSLDVEGLKPSLLSRLMDLIAPLKA